MTTKHVGSTDKPVPKPGAPSTEESSGIKLPEEVDCVLGKRTPYATFKEHYKSVYDQVVQMEHLLLGRIAYSGTMLRQLPFTVHTLKQAELGLLNSFFPMNSSTSEYLPRDMYMYELYKAIMCTESIKGTKIPASGVTFTTTKEEWKLRMRDVIAMFEFYDPTIITYLTNTYEDVNAAKQYAFMELLPNP